MELRLPDKYNSSTSNSNGLGCDNCPIISEIVDNLTFYFDTKNQKIIESGENIVASPRLRISCSGYPFGLSKPIRGIEPVLTYRLSKSGKHHLGWNHAEIVTCPVEFQMISEKRRCDIMKNFTNI